MFQELNEKVVVRAPWYSAWLLFFGTMKKVSGIIFNSGPEWRELRRFTSKTLKDLGIGKNTSEEIILEECSFMKKEITQMIQESDSGLIDLDLLFNKAALNVIWHFTGGERFGYRDKRMQSLIKFLECFVIIGQDLFSGPLAVFPFLRHFPPYKTNFKKAFDGLAVCRDFIYKKIMEHEATLDIENPRDFIDTFLIAAQKNEILNKENLLFVCFDLFSAGSETTSKSMMYAVAMLVRHPEVHDKMAQEILENTGDKDQVTLDDRETLPYTEAVMNEVWRFCNILPVTAPEISSCPVKIGQWELPANTQLTTSSYSVHMDQSYWGDPEVFRPERFITAEGKYRADDRNIPFGIGKRRCVGETVARTENFLFLANLMKNFSFTPGPDGKLPELRPQAGLTNGPQHFLVRVTKRM